MGWKEMADQAHIQLYNYIVFYFLLLLQCVVDHLIKNTKIPTLNII